MQRHVVAIQPLKALSFDTAEVRNELGKTYEEVSNTDLLNLQPRILWVGP